MAYSKQTWDSNSFVNPTRMNHIEDGIYGSTVDLENFKNKISFDASLSANAGKCEFGVFTPPEFSYGGQTYSGLQVAGIKMTLYIGTGNERTYILGSILSGSNGGSFVMYNYWASRGILL